MIYLCTSEKSRLGLDREDLDEVMAPSPEAAALKFAARLVRDGEELSHKMFVRRPTETEWLAFRVSRPITVSDTGERVRVAAKC